VGVSPVLFAAFMTDAGSEKVLVCELEGVAILRPCTQ
jgi:hypothetical protein